ncbi:MAG: hypothetical protein AAGJ28_14130 [Pseudomonadota bacterium]
MKHRAKSVFALAMIVSLSACASSVKEVYDARIDQTFAVGGGEYTSGPKIFVLAGLRQEGDNTVVCGAWAQDAKNANITGSELEVLEGTRVRHSGVTIMSGVEKFPRRKLRANMRNTLANCFLTDTVWQDSFANTPPSVVASRYQRRSSRNKITEFVPGPVPNVIQ